jgi:alkylation response protein AidB-like acyl-CoA dehydrogenase
MNFDFSDDLKMLREEARRFLAERCSTKAVRRILDGADRYDRELWQAIADMGWLGAAIPESYGGGGIGYEGLCVLAEEVGRALAPIPFSSSIYLAAEAILAAGTEAQKQQYLPLVASGKRIGTFAFAEGGGNPDQLRIRASVRNGKLSGTKLPVPDGEIADFAVVVANDSGTCSLYLVELGEKGVTRSALKSLDPTRAQAKIAFADVPAEPLATAGDALELVDRLFDRAAVLTAFEQVGGAQACLRMATSYARERYAFGRPIGSFQAIKHKLADVYVATELARSNAYYAAWALASEAAELPLAAAAARVSAIDAFHLASKENIQTHGGIGFTWESDCHLYYRRSKQLATALGSALYWKNRLIDDVERRNA